MKDAVRNNPFTNRWLLAAALALTASAGCAPADDRGSSAPPPPIDRLEDDGDRGPMRDEACPAHVPFVASVRTRVIDPVGVGLADARVQLCVWTNEARMLCLEPGRTDANGDVIIDVAEAARCMVRASARVLLPQSHRPALYCAMELPLDDASVTVAAPYVLIDAAVPASLPSLGDESVARTVDFELVSVEVTPDAIGAEQYQRLAATTLALDQAPACLAAAAPAFDLLVAFAPEVDIAGAGFPFSVENTLGLDAATSLEVLVQAGVDCRLADGTLLEKGAWHELGSAMVNEDSTRIELSGTTALPCLGWIGLLR